MSNPVAFPIFRITDPVLALGAARQLQQRGRPIHSSSGTLLQRLDDE
ncbi:hypothetical protein ACFW20_27935 [Streptomyces nigra]